LVNRVLLSYCWCLVLGPSLGIAHQYGFGDVFGYTNVNRYWNFSRGNLTVGYWPTNLAYGKRTVEIPDLGLVETEISFVTNRFDPLVSSNQPLQNFDLWSSLPHYRGGYGVLSTFSSYESGDEPAWSTRTGEYPHHNISSYFGDPNIGYYSTMAANVPTNKWSVNLFLYPVLAITNDTYTSVTYSYMPPSGYVTNQVHFQEIVRFVDPWGKIHPLDAGLSKNLTNGWPIAFYWTNTVVSSISFSNSYLLFEAYTNVYVGGAGAYGVGAHHTNKIYFNYWDVALYSILNHTTHMLAEPFYATNVPAVGSNHIASISIYPPTVTLSGTTASTYAPFRVQRSYSLTESFTTVHTNFSDGSGYFLCSFTDPTPSSYLVTNIIPPGWYADGGFNPYYQSYWITNVVTTTPPVFYRLEL